MGALSNIHLNVVCQTGCSSQLLNLPTCFLHTLVKNPGFSCEELGSIVDYNLTKSELPTSPPPCLTPLPLPKSENMSRLRQLFFLAYINRVIGTLPRTLYHKFYSYNLVWKTSFTYFTTNHVSLLLPLPLCHGGEVVAQHNTLLHHYRKHVAGGVPGVAPANVRASAAASKPRLKARAARPCAAVPPFSGGPYSAA